MGPPELVPATYYDPSGDLVLPYEDVWGGSDADDSDWEGDHEPSDEQVAAMERG